MRASTLPQADVRAVGRAAAFLDRDGTIIPDLDYLADPAQVRLFPGAGTAFRKLAAAGIPVVIVTNQSGIGRGYFTEADFYAVQARVEALIRSAGGHVLATYHCPHAPDTSPPCECRKPAPGLFQRAAADLDLDLERSAYIGDRVRDIEAGLAFGGTAYLVSSAGPGEESVPPGVGIVTSLEEAVDRLLAGGFPTGR